MFRSIKQYFNKKNLKDKKYEFLFENPSDDEYVCFDCETTGLNPRKDDIVSIGAVIIRNNTIVSSKKFVKLNKNKWKGISIKYDNYDDEDEEEGDDGQSYTTDSSSKLSSNK
jgi:DNA polymerase-3 subunit epsilon